MSKHNSESSSHKKQMFSAASSNKVNQLIHLIENGVPVDVRDEYGTTPLMVAAESQNIESISFFLNNGANVNLADLEGNTALIHAIVHKPNGAVIEKLILMGADINQQNVLGRTALIESASRGVLENTNTLLRFTPNLNVITHDDETALSFAIVWEEKEIVELLIKAGADTKWIGKDNCTLLHFAEETGNPDIINLLIVP